jgi:hypothetical protein
MDKKQAQEIVKNTFENPFDKIKFIGFVKNLLNSIEEAPFSYKGNFIPDAYDQSVSTLERIGKYTDGEHKIDILVVKLRKETSIERARTMQRNFIAWYLNGSRGGEMKDAALAAFVSPNAEDWRFSLVKMDYRFEEGKNGRVKVKEEFTPARRWSFLVGKNENSHTAQSKLFPIIADDEHNPTLALLEEAFNIEKVTKEFFEKYRELFLRTKETLDEVFSRNKIIKADFEAKGVNTVDFTKKLLGQIVFLYFLQKKGWFGVQRDADWGTGPKHFLRELFDGRHGKYKNFFNDILEPLFYEALRIDRSHDDDDYYSRFNCKIPFLNGGLFDPINNYDWVHTDILLPNELFSNTFKTKEGDTGNGILDIFDRYNFTVKEDEPLEKEVAIDPELLGKAYEKFNVIRSDNYEEYKKALKSGQKGAENKFNKQYGVYYTPREIVHYMCQQSLTNCLATELEGKVNKEDIDTLIKYGEQVGENEATVETKGRETRTYFYKLPESIRLNAKLVDEKLADMKVCDPAVGSGAFPVGMMSEIVKTRNVLSAFTKAPDRMIYNFKRECIEKSLYGADIDPGAVEIAKLRLWLSLVVDEEDIKQIKPLPNLDYKIVCGNSLLGVEKNLFNDALFKELERLKPILFNETSPRKKQEYKKQIDGLISQITNGHKEFDFQVYFSEVFHNKGGFDVVIANPPYIFARESKKKGLTENDKKYFYEHYELTEYQLNLYPLFIEKGTNLLRPKGCLCFISPNNWLTINTNKTLRKFVLSQSDIAVVNFYARVFESCAVDSSIIIYRRCTNNPRVALFEYTDGFDFIKEADCGFFLGQRDHIINIEAFKGSGSSELIEKIESQSVKLSDLASVKAGLKAYETGTGNPPQTDTMKKNRVYHSARRIDNTYIKYLDGKDVCRYRIGWSGEFLKYGDNLAAPRKDFRLYSTKRILVRQIPAKLPYCIHACSIEETALNDLNSMNIINIRESPECVLGILNSRLTSFWFIHKFGKMQRETFPQFKVNELAQFPLPKNRDKKQNEIAEAVRQILAAKKRDPEADTNELEREIDQMMYKLYGLTEGEIRIVEGE